MSEKLEITITKTSEGLKIDHTENADLHEVIGILAVSLNHLTLSSNVDFQELVRKKYVEE